MELRFTQRLCLALVSVFYSALVYAPIALAQSSPVDKPRDFQTYSPRVKPVFIQSENKPIIDGDLSDPAWENAGIIDEFYQVEPVLGAQPSERTEIYLLYDETALYVGVKAFDSSPDKIRATILEKDGDVWRDDMLRFYIDPFNTGISGLGFDVNGLGARADRLVQANRRPVDEWNVIWDSAGNITAEGWVAEFVIPFRSISFDPKSDRWGLMITRELAHKHEEIRWAGIDRSVNKFGFERPGYLEGIKDVDAGIGLDIQGFAATAFRRDWQLDQDKVTFNPSANISYKFNPSLTGLLTFNSDFSDTPLDNRQINTGRFSLFFPETRDFFLQDAAFFEFAGETFSRSPNGRPFFSRRIGIVGPEQVTIDAGGKISGEWAGFDVGILSTLMESTDSLDTQLLSVARATRQITPKARLGFIATNGDPGGESDSTLLGFDGLYKTPKFFGGGQMQIDSFFQQTFSPDGPNDSSYGVRAEYPNDIWNWSVGFKEIGRDFNPQLGFVNRPGTRDYNMTWKRRKRFKGGELRYVEAGTSHQFITDLSNNLETRETALNLGLQNSSTDTVTASVFENFENISSAFNLPLGIAVPAGEYQNNGAKIRLESSRVRPYGMNVEAVYQDFFGGNRAAIDTTLFARPSPHFDLRLGYEIDDISVPDGDVTIHVGSLEAVINISPDLSISTQTQYDNISEGFSLFGRLRWEMRPETEVFVSFGHGAIIEREAFPNRFESIETQVIFRIGNTFRF